MIARVRRVFPTFMLLVSVVLLVSGCNGTPTDQDNPEHQKMLGMTEEQKRQAQIDKIKNNPKMPEAAKEMAIGMLSRNHK